MAYGETILFQSWLKDSIIKRLRDCGCDAAEIEECWNSFVVSVAEVHEKLKGAKKTGDFAGISDLTSPFLDLVQNLHAVDLMIYTKNLDQALRNKDLNGIDRAANDLLKICEKYLDDSEDEGEESL